MRLVPAEYYLLECTEEGELHFTWSRGGDEGKTIKVSEEVREKVDAMRREYNLNKLKESYTPPFNVLDGVMWHVEFRYENRDKSIYSSGENAWPAERLREGITAINTYLLSLGEAATEADIIGRIPYRDL